MAVLQEGCNDKYNWLSHENRRGYTFLVGRSSLMTYGS